MVDMDTLVSLCKRRGFVFQSSEIYGGLGSAWDYGPLGVEMRRNIRHLWWRDVVRLRRDVVGLEAAVLMHPRVWEASGHLERFSDPMIDCKACKRRFRADHLDERPWLHYCPAKKDSPFEIPAGAACRHCGARRTLCPECGRGELTEPRQFNMMLKTFLGPVEEAAAATYLRPETAQGMFVNFENVLQSTRRKLPFGIAQIGRSFRNEITPGNFIFRTREFEQMELEFFVNPLETIDGRPADEWWHQHWIDARLSWYLRYGIRADNLRLREHAKEELEHMLAVAERINQLGGKPDFNPQGLATRSASQYVEGENLVDMIKENLIAERIAIDHYRELIRYFGDNDPGTRVMLEKILTVEEEHANDMHDLLVSHEGKPMLER